MVGFTSPIKLGSCGDVPPKEYSSKLRMLSGVAG